MFRSGKYLTSTKKEIHLTAIRNIKRVYALRGFIVRYMYMDGEFECLRYDLADMKIHLNIVSRDEHVPEIERSNRAIKDRVRCVYNSLPFTQIPDRMIINIIYGQFFWLNVFPTKNEISKKSGPRLLLTGKKIDCKIHCSIECGQYVQTHE